MKTRIPYIIAAVIAMILGFSTRRFAGALPAFAAEHFGDALWASMIYFGVRAVWVHKRLFWAALISVLFCFGIELSQLYQSDWINEIRSTFFGTLVLGSGFLTVDLARYSAGIVLALLIDGYFSKRGLRG
ncbi:ribosomal maturation YjgA family protein [Paenibacillus sp. Soil522]|uniref:ribosomal maturation YjgA family protein n=1 Tax=Paenibacillus sp. Soil522 TaxID=1736388 RepID=UPI000AA968E7|nr:DUF2809 domain-containing protein [Paenibacillus sp. Soil522]